MFVKFTYASYPKYILMGELASREFGPGVCVCTAYVQHCEVCWQYITNGKSEQPWQLHVPATRLIKVYYKRQILCQIKYRQTRDPVTAHYIFYNIGSPNGSWMITVRVNSHCRKQVHEILTTHPYAKEIFCPEMFLWCRFLYLQHVNFCYVFVCRFSLVTSVGKIKIR